MCEQLQVADRAEKMNAFADLIAGDPADVVTGGLGEMGERCVEHVE